MIADNTMVKNIEARWPSRFKRNYSDDFKSDSARWRNWMAGK